jgi:hypothetical protein
MIDRPYLARLLRVLRRARETGWIGRAWFYTRAWKGGLLGRKHKRALESLGVVVYASVFGAREILDARTAGYLVAVGMPGRAKADEAFGRSELNGGAMKCMEQVAKARKHAVVPTCDRCLWCPRGKGDVVFFVH